MSAYRLSFLILVVATAIALVVLRRLPLRIAITTQTPRPALSVTPTSVTPTSVTPTSTPLPAPLAPLPPPVDVAIVFTVGEATYVVIDDLLLSPPTHAAAELVRGGDYEAAVAEVAPRNIPQETRKLLRGGVKVDGSCTARVTGYAIVARLRGLPSDVGIETKGGWTAQDVLDHGHSVLAARIEGCSGMYARPASHPEIAIFAESYSRLADVARERFVTSTLVDEVQQAWAQAGEEGDWYARDGGSLEVRVFIHPRTRVEWVVAQAYRYGDCGQIGGSIIGIYRPQHGKLVEVALRSTPIEHVVQVIDIDGDGQPELVGSTPSSAQIERADGTDVTSLEVPQLGCGC